MRCFVEIVIHEIHRLLLYFLFLSQVMRLESWKQHWTGGHGGQNVRSFSVETESELDDRDLRICLQDHINATTQNSPEV